MGLLKEIIFHFGCDMRNCHVSGKGEELPDGWHFLNLNLRATTPAGDVNVVEALICPECSIKIMKLVHNQKKVAPNGQK